MEKSKKQTLTLISLALPILVELVLRSLMGTVNTFFLSKISDDASAAVGVANQILNIVIITSTMLASGAAVMINQNLGANKKDIAAKITMNSITISAAVGLLVSLLLVSCAPIFIGWIGLENDLFPIAVSYLRIVGASCFVQFVSSMIATHFRCRKKAYIAMLVIVFNNVINLVGSLLVIHQKLPLTGVTGIAAVRLCSEALGLILIALLFALQRWGLILKDLVRINPFYAKEILRLGFMTGLEGISFNMAQLVTTSFITMLPSVVLSAKVYAQTINNYNSLIGMAIGQAVQILSGYMIGAGESEKAYRFVRKSYFFVLLSNMVFCISFFIFSSELVGLFTASEEIKAIVKTLFFIDIFTAAGRALNHSFNYGLRSAGYVFYPMISANTCIWTLAVGLGYLLSVSCGLGILGIWIAQTIDEWTRGSVAAVLWLKKKWTSTSLVQKDSQ